MTLHEFIDRLGEQKLHDTLASYRDHAIMISVAVPGERWEVEFFDDGTIEVEVFRSISRGLEGEEALERLFAENID